MSELKEIREKVLVNVKEVAGQNEEMIKDAYKRVMKLERIARREGLLALEDTIRDYEGNPFLKKGIQLIVDGTDVEQLRSTLEGSTYFMKQRHKKGAEMVNMIATTAPALGLLGTYVGLIPMLNNLDDPTTLGPMMALELVSSFYGAFLAYVIFAPLAKRLKNMSQEEESRRELLIEGLVAIAVGKNPRQLKDDLAAFYNIDIDTLEETVYRDKLKAQEVMRKL